MKLTILGEYGPFAPAGGACSSYLLQGKKGGNILLDLGNGGLAQLQKYAEKIQVEYAEEAMKVWAMLPEIWAKRILGQ